MGKTVRNPRFIQDVALRKRIFNIKKTEFLEASMKTAKMYRCKIMGQIEDAEGNILRFHFDETGQIIAKKSIMGSSGRIFEKQEINERMVEGADTKVKDKENKLQKTEDQQKNQ